MRHCSATVHIRVPLANLGYHGLSGRTVFRWLLHSRCYDQCHSFASSRMEIDICPRWVLAKLRIPEPSRHHVALLVSTLVTLALLPLAIHIPHLCLMQKVLGIPCPGCGVCHSVIAMLHLSPVRAWEANPAGVGVALVFCFQLVARPIAITVPGTGVLVSQVSRHMSNVALGSLLLVWVSRVF